VALLYKLFICLFNFLIYFLPYLFTVLSIGPFRFQARGRRRRPNLALFFVFLYVVVLFCYGCMFAFVVLQLFSVQAKRLAGMNVSEITYFVSGWT